MNTTNRGDGNATLRAKRQQMSQHSEEERMRIALERLQRAVEEPQRPPAKELAAQKTRHEDLRRESNSKRARDRVDLTSNNRREISCRSLMS
jgi:hypothetical protein